MTDYYGVVTNRDYIKLDGKRLPFWEFLDRQPDGWLCSLAYRRDDVPHDKTRIWDCGAWSYRNEDTPRLNGADVTPGWVIGEYKRVISPGDFAIAPDHMLIPGVDYEERRKFNHVSAKEFIERVKLTDWMPIEPMAVVHGRDEGERVSYALWLYAIGYRALAIGGLAGMAGHKRVQIISSVAAVRDAAPNVWLHVLGVSAPSYAAEWNRLGVDSFDGASHFKQAFTAGKFYVADRDRLVTYQAARPGEPATAPECGCKACALMREDGVDTRRYGSNETNMGRAAHNLNQLMRALRWVL